jgi:RNA polymerase sigma factor (sigma-70 family)
MAADLEALVARAQDGDHEAVESIVLAISDDVYGLAMRMLWHPADAEDASQEILVKVVTNLGSFRGESRFTTWVYRIAANHLLTTRKRRAEQERLTFRRFGTQLAEGLSDAAFQTPSDVEEGLLVEEVKIGCTQAMLLCLDREHRLIYILGEVFGVTSEIGGEILEITPAAFRKRLSRSRQRLRTFMQDHCGLVNDAVPCRCARRVDHAITIGRVDPHQLLFAGHPEREAGVDLLLTSVREMDAMHSAAAVFRSHPSYAAPEHLLTAIKQLLDAGAPNILARDS